MLKSITVAMFGIAVAVFSTAMAFAETAPSDAEASAAEVRAVYADFAAAQNARDPERIRSFFTDDPGFLWVSDGKSFFGADAVVARMTRFQKAEIWRVEPDLDAAEVIGVGSETRMLHMPLTLVIGRAAAPNRIRFLVSILFVEQPQSAERPWRIAALLTTLEKP
ncbi:MAG: SgcJ/EcaC family oxidoreductase [Pseudomonadota bacterium]